MSSMTSSQRVFTALSHQEPDRVPLVLSLTLHGAKELGMSIREYFSSADHVVEGQMRLWRKYGHDALLGFLYGALEYEAWGGEAVFVEDGPPTSGEPLWPDGLDAMPDDVPNVADSPHLQRALAVIRQLKSRVEDTVPVMGVVLSPFSFPVMQLGFDAYLDLLYGPREPFWKLMAINQAFTLAWGQAQLHAGATALAYFDPLASPTMLPRELYLETGFQVAQHTLPRLGGPTVTHLASGRALGVLDLIMATGTGGVGVSCLDDLREVKRQCAGRLGVIGNLNGLAMVHWSADDAVAAARLAISQAASGGGYLLSDNHGELPWYVPDEVIGTLAEAVRTWGAYPLRQENHA